MRMILIMCGGAIGAALRYLVHVGFIRLAGKDFPYGTLFVNVSGSFLLGYLGMFFLHKMPISEDLRIAMLVGVLGAFTTFSTFSLETVQLFEHGTYLKAALNIALNLFLSIGAVMFGMTLVK